MREIMNIGVRCLATGLAWTEYGKERNIYLLSVVGPENAVKSIWATFVQKAGELRLDNGRKWGREAKGDKFTRATFVSKRYATQIDRETNYWNLVIIPTNLPHLLWVRNPACANRPPTAEEQLAARSQLQAQLLTFVNTKNTVALPQWAPWLWQRSHELSAFSKLNVSGDVLEAVTIKPDINWAEVVAHGLETNQISF